MSNGAKENCPSATKQAFSKLNEVAMKIDQPRSAGAVLVKYAIQGAVGYLAVEGLKKGFSKAKELKARRKAS